MACQLTSHALNYNLPYLDKYFDQKKVHFIAKIDSFLISILVYFYLLTIKYTETLILYFFVHENMKKNLKSRIVL